MSKKLIGISIDSGLYEKLEQDRLAMDMPPTRSTYYSKIMVYYLKVNKGIPFMFSKEGKL